MYGLTNSSPVSPQLSSGELGRKWQQQESAQAEIAERAGLFLPVLRGLHNSLIVEAVPTNVEMVQTRRRQARLGSKAIGRLTGSHLPSPATAPVTSLGRGWRLAGQPYSGGLEDAAIPNRTITLMESGDLLMGEPYLESDVAESLGLVSLSEFPLHPLFTVPEGFVDTTVLGDASTPEARVRENLAYFERSVHEVGRHLLSITTNGA